MERCPNVGGSVEDISGFILQVTRGEIFLSSDPEQFLFPFVVGQPGHLHIVYNALQHAVESLASWTKTEAALRDLTAFLGHKGLRRRFARLCCPAPLRRKFCEWSTKHIDWKWEFLSGVLDALSWRFAVLLDNYDFATLNVNETGQKMDSALLKRIGNLVPQKKVLLARFEALRIIAKSIDRCAHWLEGCPCHEKGLVESGGYRARKRSVQSALTQAGQAGSTCPWAGRRSCEMVLGQVDVFLSWVRGAWSEKLNKTLHELEAAPRSLVLGELDALKGSITEEIGSKMSHHRELPWKVCLHVGEWVSQVIKRTHHRCLPLGPGEAQH